MGECKHQPASERLPSDDNGLAAFSLLVRCFRRLPSLKAALLTLLLLSSVPIVFAQQTDEYHVKAAFLFHFAQLVDWPADALGDKNKPFTFCMIGQDSFDGGLEATLAGKAIGSRTLQIRHLKQAHDVPGCQLVFIGGRERKRTALWLSAIKDEAVLTMGESDDFAKEGGMIGFCMENEKVRFEINVDAAARANLKISSRLLLLAKTVIGNH